MFELPEFVVLAKQFNQTLVGKVILQGELGNMPHKFVWYNRAPQEFTALSQGKTVGEAWSRGKWLFTPLDPGYLLLLGECGGRVLYHPKASDAPQKYHLYLAFEDGSALTATTQMWGAMELYTRGEEQGRQYVKDMRIPPDDPAFTFAYFSELIDSLLAGEKRSVKGLLTQDQLIPGLGNACAQDILYQARLHPRHPITELNIDQRQQLYAAIQQIIQEIIALGGRYDEIDLYGRPGGYVRQMDKNAVGKPCPVCGSPIEKIQYLGGACYFCPSCQK
jgi:formamidopyrimidine-DNA glycosylase